MQIHIEDHNYECHIGKKAICSKGIVGTITGIALMPWGYAFVGVTSKGVAWSSQHPTLCPDMEGPTRDAIIEAAAALYYAGCWRLDRPGNEALLWENLRDACGFTPGKAPMQWANTD